MALRPVQPDDLAAIRTIEEVQLSPDGRRVAYTLTEVDAAADEYRSAIWVVPADGGAPVQFTRGTGRDRAPRWSPGGTALAFLSDRDGGAPQLYVMPAAGGEARRVTALDRGAGPAVWSPDGARILFAARAFTEAPPSDPLERARWAQRPRVVTRAQYKADGQGYTLDTTSQVFVVEAAGGQARQLTAGGGDSQAPAWSPDGRRIAFSRARGGAADYNLLDLWVMDADGGHARRLTERVGRAMSPAWSPDGTTIACYGTDEQQPGFGESMVRVWTVPAAGGPPHRLTGGYDRAAVLVPRGVTPGPVWSGDGRALTFIASDCGNAHVVRAAVPEGTVRTVVGGERQIQSVSAAAGRLAFVATDPQTPADVYVCAWDGSGERRLTHVNDPLLSHLALPRVERRTFPAPHGGTVEGWVVRPPAGRGPAPLLVDIHGGPHSFHGSAFPVAHLERYVLASRGWTVLALNPTGSGSYGKAFAHGIRGRWGEYDLPEQMAALDALVADGIADPARLAVAGYSYGGFMASWTITHTDRFKAAVVGAPVVNLESFRGTSDIGLWFATWEAGDDPASRREAYRRLSPIHYADRAATPTLIIHGEADDRCPIGQGEELFIALLEAGRAPVEFVRYPGESHLFLSTGRPRHRLDVVRRVAEWVERYTLGRSPS
jgi:dipeptidyl aminopeptidase/acylaminoacyl peptidase